MTNLEATPASCDAIESPVRRKSDAAAWDAKVSAVYPLRLALWRTGSTTAHTALGGCRPGAGSLELASLATTALACGRPVLRPEPRKTRRLLVKQISQVPRFQA